MPEEFNPFDRTGPVEISAEDEERLSREPQPLRVLIPVVIQEVAVKPEDATDFYEEDEDPEEIFRKFDEALASGEQVCITAPPYEREFSELSASGLLWAINRTLLHPRGYALAIHKDGDGNAVGWSLRGNGREPWKYYPDAEEDESFAAFERTLTDQMFRAAEEEYDAEVAKREADNDGR
jgi:hypothetical protein